MYPNKLSSLVLNSLRPATALIALAILAAAGLAGCGGDTVAPKSLVPLALHAQRVGASAARGLAPGMAALAPATATSTVEFEFTKALLVIRDVRFKLAGAEADGDSLDDGESIDVTSAVADGDSLDDGDDGEDEGGAGMVVFRGPFVVDLMSHQSAGLDTELVEPGDYRRVQGHLRALRESDAAATEELSFLVGSTVHLEGTIAGEGGGPFAYSARLDDEFQLRGRFTVESGTPATAFITFDLSSWLLDRDGHFLDPRLEENAQAIRSAIRHSIKVWMDGNHDGVLAEHEMEGEE